MIRLNSKHWKIWDFYIEGTEALESSWSQGGLTISVFQKAGLNTLWYSKHRGQNPGLELGRRQLNKLTVIVQKDVG